MCKGSQTTTQQSASAPDPQAYSMYSDLLKRAQTVAGQPYTPYGGELVAPNNAQQMSGVANINAMQGYYPLALGMQYNAAQPVSTQQIEQYQNPFTKDVVNATQAQFANQNQQQLEALRGRSISQGALGGNRQGIAEAELANQQNLAQSPVIANLTSQGYLTGLNTALTEQQAASQGAYGIANLANAGLTGANAQVGAGSLLQNTQQAQDAANYQQYLTALGYPFQTTQWLAGLGTGVGSQMGGTNSGSTTGPAPSMLGQLMGGVAGGAGILGSTGAFGSAGWLGLAGLKRGGRVHGYADGGVANLDLGDDAGDGAGSGPLPESDATLHAQQRQLLTGDRRAQMFPSGTPELELPQGMARTQTQNGVFHYNPSQLSADTIHDLSGQDRENELLDLGPVSKREVMQRVARGEHPLAVVERDPDGNEVRTAAGTNVTAPAQLAAMHRTKSHGHSVRIENPHAVLAQRLHARGHIPHRDMGGSVVPYAGGKSWIPTSGITPGHGAQGMSAPQLHSPDGGFDINKQAKNIGYLADAMKGFGNNGLGDDGLGNINDPNWTGGTPLEGGAPIGGGGIGSARRGGAIRRRGGMVGVANGYAGGGAPDNAIVFDPDFAGAPADQFMPVGVAPSTYDEAGFDSPRPSKADLAAVSPSRDYDNYDFVQAKASAANMPSFSEPPLSSSYDESGFTGADFGHPVRRINAYTDGVVPPANYKSAFNRFREGNPTSAADVPVATMAGARGSNADLAPVDSSTGDWGWGKSDPYAAPSIVPTGIAPPAALATGKPIDTSGVVFPSDDTFSTPSPAGGPPSADSLVPTFEPGFTTAQTTMPMPPRRPATGVEPISEARSGDIAYPTAGYVPTMDRYGRAIASIESGGNYRALGPVTADGDMAYGKYQVMGKNVGPWTQEILGRLMSPTEFLHSSEAQDTVFRGKFGQYVNRFGPEGAARAWLGGPGNVNNPNAKDMLGTSVADYGHRFMTALNGSPAGDGYALAFNGEPSDASVPAHAHPVQYAPSAPSGVANASGIDLGANSKLWPTLMAAGFGMMASRSPFAGNAIGEGGLTGLQTYSGLKQQEQAQALSGRKLDLEAQKLSTQADRWEKDYRVKSQQANTNEEYRRSLAERGKYQWSPGLGPATDADGKPLVGPDGHPVQVPGMYRLPSQTSDDTVEPKFFPGQTISGKVNRTMTPLEIDREARLRAAQDVGKPDDPRWIGKGDAYNKALEAARTRHQDEMRQRYGLPSTGAPPPAAPVNPAAPSVSAAPPPAANALPPRPPSVPQTAKPYSNGRETRWATPDGLYFNDKGQRINAQGQVI